MKLLVPEAESEALRRHLGTAGPHVTSALSRVEVVRSVARAAPAAVGRARVLFADIQEVPLDRSLLDDAAVLPVDVRSLDAIHLAAARRLGRHLTALVTYDRRMAVAADDLGLPVAMPG